MCIRDSVRARLVRRRGDDARQLQPGKRGRAPDRCSPHIACSPHCDSKHAITLAGCFVTRLTVPQLGREMTCQVRFWFPDQPDGYLGRGNCSRVLCVEVTERYSSGQLLVGNLVKSTQPQVAFSTRRKRCLLYTSDAADE